MVLTAGNPKRKRKAKKRRAAASSSSGGARRRRRRPRRNPSLSLPRIPVAGVDLMKVGVGIAGGLGTVMGVNALAPMLPRELQTGWGRLGLKASVIAIAGMLLPNLVGRETSRDIVFGAATVVGVDAVREFLAPHVPGLSGLTESPYISSRALAGYVMDGPSLASSRLPSWAQS